LPPPAMYASRTASEAFWSVVQPNVLPPRQRAATFNPLRPRLRISTGQSPFGRPYQMGGLERAPQAPLRSERPGEAVALRGDAASAGSGRLGSPLAEPLRP